MKYRDCYEDVYAHYYAEAVEYGVEWTDEHDKFVEDAASDLQRYIGDSIANFYNFEASELPGLKEQLEND